MFDLNDAIRRWRGRLQNQPDILSADVDELEDHLRESVAELRGSGLSEEEAFLVAARRLGDPEALAGEFASADSGVRRRARLRWIVVGGLALLFLIVAADGMVSLSTQGMMLFAPDAWWLGWSTGFVRLLVFAIGGALIWRLLTDDAAAGKLRGLGAVGAVVLAVVSFSLLLVLATAFVRAGASGIMALEAPGVHLVTVHGIAHWMRTGVLLALPFFMLVGLWALVKSGKRA